MQLQAVAKTVVLILTLTFAEGGFRLVNIRGEPVNSTGVYGLLLFNDGTVCKDDFSNNSAAAICKELGFRSAGSWEYGQYYYPLQDSYGINLDNVRCSTASWPSCTYSHFPDSCDHTQDVFLNCTGNCKVLSSFDTCGATCPGGEYRSSLSFQCTTCEPNTYRSGESAKQNCISCPSPSFTKGPRTECRCPEGMMWKWDTKTTGSCTVCPENTFRSDKTNRDMKTCAGCPLGSISSPGSSNCTCPGDNNWVWYPHNPLTDAQPCNLETSKFFVFNFNTILLIITTLLLLLLLVATFCQILERKHTHSSNTDLI